MTNKTRVFLVFFLQPLVFGAWLPRIPEIQAQLGLDFQTLSFALIGLPVGTLLTLPFSGAIVARLGARRVLLGWFPLFMLASLAPLLAPSFWFLFVGLMLVGSTMSLLELGLNIMADEAEKQAKISLMNTAHGLWSFGLMTGSLLGTGAAALGIAPLWAAIIISVTTLPLAIINGRALPKTIDAPATTHVKKSRFALPHPILLGICVFTLGTAMTEGAMADWSALYLRDVFNADPGLAGLGVTFFTLMVALTRICGDRLKEMFGAAWLARVLAVVGICGILLLFFSQNIFTAIAGFAVVGIGAALGFPLAVTAAANAPGTNAASNVAILSFIALSGFLIGPPLIGNIAQYTDLRLGILILVPILGLSVSLAHFLSPRYAKTAEPVSMSKE